MIKKINDNTLEMIPTNEEKFIRAQKRVKDIIGFYTHVAVSPFIIPLIIFINLRTYPQFHWYWLFIALWILGILTHWLTTFKLAKTHFIKEWKQKKIKEIMGDQSPENYLKSDSSYLQELAFIRARKRIKEIKGFYMHLVVTLFSIPLVIWVNITFVPEFQFFWFAAGGMLIAIFIHWLGLFGFAYLGLGQDWEQRKIKQFIEHEEF